MSKRQQGHDRNVKTSAQVRTILMARDSVKQIGQAYLDARRDMRKAGVL
jgi:hypothetical protein